MQYRKLGKTGFEASALGFGAMRLPRLDDGGVDHNEAIRCFHRAFELGVNYVDTAFGYHGGESEVVVGKALKGHRDKVKFATKNPYKGDSGEEWMQNLETQLERLDTDHIDFLLSHGLNWEAYSGSMSVPGGPMDMFRKARDQGKIGEMCFSSHDSPENIKKLIDTGEFATMTVQYNLLDRHNEEVIAWASEKGMGVIAMGPVAGGRLVAPSDTIQNLIPGEVGSSPEMALRFVLANPNISVALSGMGNMQMVEENAATCARTNILSQEELDHMEKAMEEVKKFSDLYCTGCGYCMPCPQDIHISHAFSLMNMHRVWGQTEYARSAYQRWAEKGKPPWLGKYNTAAACVECGKCEQECPQDIPIIEQLKEVEAVLGKGS
ncbi:MAG: aldo/keto reductase [Candidatus Sumerlaeota bacterium]